MQRTGLPALAASDASTPRRQLGDHGSSRKDLGVQHQLFIDFGMILGPRFESVLGLEGLNSMFCFGLVSRSLFASILDELLTVGVLKTGFS